MPPPYRNPDYTEDNGQDEYLHYGPPNPNYVPPGQSNSQHPGQGITARQGQANMTRRTRGSQSRGMPHNSMASNTGNTVVPSNSGIPLSAGAAINTGARNNAGATQNSNSGPQMPRVPVNTGVYTAHGQARSMTGQPLFRQPAAPPQMSAQRGSLRDRPTTGGRAPTPVDDEAQLRGYIDRRQKLRNVTGRNFSELVRNSQEFEWFLKADARSRRREGPDLSGDMPRDEAGQAELVDRLGDAIANLVNIESRKTRMNQSKRGDVEEVDSTGVKYVKEKKDYDIAMLAWMFMVSVRLHPKCHYIVGLCFYQKLITIPSDWREMPRRAFSSLTRSTSLYHTRASCADSAT